MPDWLVDGDFWAGVGLAAVIATALSTGVSTVAAMWWRRHDRQRVEWVLVEGESAWVAPEPDGLGLGDDFLPHATARLMSVGDGTAYQVRIDGDGCRAQLTEGSTSHGRPLISVMEPGASSRLRVVCEPDWWEGAGIWVWWVESPTWRKRSRRRQWIPLSQVARRPVYGRLSFNEISGQYETQQLPEPAPPVLPRDMRSLEPRNGLSGKVGGPLTKWRVLRHLRPQRAPY